jgi:hypothetical protein
LQHLGGDWGRSQPGDADTAGEAHSTRSPTLSHAHCQQSTTATTVRTRADEGLLQRALTHFLIGECTPTTRRSRCAFHHPPHTHTHTRTHTHTHTRTHTQGTTTRHTHTFPQHAFDCRHKHPVHVAPMIRLCPELALGSDGVTTAHRHNRCMQRTKGRGSTRTSLHSKQEGGGRVSKLKAPPTSTSTLPRSMVLWNIQS